MDARCMDEPAVTVWRLPNPPMPIGTVPVSPAITLMSSGSTPS